MANIQGTFLPDILLGTLGDDVIAGLGGDDIISGLSGNDTLDGGAGQDTLIGGTGDDTYIIDIAAGDAVAYSRLLPLLGLDIRNGVVVEVLGDTARVQVNLGNGDEIVLVSLGSLSLLGEQVQEFAGEGEDTIKTGVSYDQADSVFVEHLRTTNDDGTAAINLVGNSLSNRITGNAGSNTLNGEGSDDVLFGLDGNDWLYGGEGNDALEGGNGLDTMTGGHGSDTYYVDNAGDIVNETANEGSDRVAAVASYMLASGSEIELLEAEDLYTTYSIDLTGNEIANIIVGNNGVNFLRGEGGNDVLSGAGGDDYLIGGIGADLMSGGLGNDTFYVDSSGDHVQEMAGEGTDRVATTVSYTLDAGSEIEMLEVTNITDTANLHLGGNEFNNTIVGNFGDNILIGGGGNDTLRGNSGNDTYYVSDSDTVVLESENDGTDRVATSVSLELRGGAEVERLEAITLSATDALVLTGSDFANMVSGNNGNNTLNGRGGNDTLTGHGGSDTFQFSSALGSRNADHITDFVSGTDKIALDDAVFTGLFQGSLPGGAFHIGSSAADAGDRIIFNPNTGALSYDADGAGGADSLVFAMLDNGASVAASDFGIH